MKISLVQSGFLTSGVRANLDRLDGLIGSGNGADVYVLHEMFSQGQCIDPTAVAETMDGESVSWLMDKADALDAAVIGTLAIRENGLFRNRLIMAMPGGRLEYYDKHHLFGYSGESRFFTAGCERRIVSFRGVRFLLQVCYDLRFPVFCRNRDDYDVAVFPAYWPIRRQVAWDILLRARAIENQAYVIGVNAVGEDMFGQYDGHSVLVGPYGDILASAPDRQECMVTGEIDMERLEHFRTKFPVLADGIDD